MTSIDPHALPIPFGSASDWVLCVEEPATGEPEVAARAVAELLAGLNPDGARIGVLWSSSTSGSEAYSRVLGQLGHPPARDLAELVSLSGADAVAAVVSTRFRLTGPTVSTFGPWSDHHLWLAQYYVDTARADLMLVGFSLLGSDSVVAGVRVVEWNSRGVPCAVTDRSTESI
ncbi:hypothetical protein AB0N05_01950 [Nocardia sp. NPDC051030]|uniref:hypothetical protein n=1 Tax=Nocardia sp. NPDC051030 TaxID=3155162 RepID=UPI00343DB006